MEKIKALLCICLWYGLENKAKARVSWDDCTMPKIVGGPSLISPKDAMKTLMGKWIIQALLPGKHSTNLLIIPRYRIM